MIQQVQKDLPNYHTYRVLGLKDNQVFRLRCFGDCQDMQVGEHWFLHYKTYQPHLRNSGSFVDQHSSRELLATIVRDSHNHRVVVASRLNRHAIYLNLLSNWFENKETVAVFSALALNDKRYFTKTIWDVFKKTGTSHLVAMSGLHVGLMVGLLMRLWMGFLALFFPSLLSRFSLYFNAIGVCALTSVMFAWVDNGYSIERSLFMAVTTGFIGLCRSHWQLRYLLFFTFFSLLLCDPEMLFSVGAWLSFFTVWVLSAYTQSISDIHRLWFVTPLQCVVVFLYLLPVCLYFFHTVSLLSPFVNLVAVPWFSLTVIPLLVLSLFASLYCEFLAKGFAILADWFFEPIYAGLHFSASLPHTQWSVKSFSLPLTLVTLIGLRSLQWLIFNRPCVIMGDLLSRGKKKMKKINNFWMRSSYRRLLYHVRPYLSYLIVGIVATLLISGVDSFFAWLIKPMINQMFGVVQSIWIRFIPLIVLSLFAFRAFVTFVSSSFISRASRFVIMDLRQAIFDRLITLPLRFFSNNKTGELVSLVVYNVEQVSDATSQTIVNALQDAALVVGLLVMMVSVSWKMSLFILTICPLVYYLLRYVSRRTRLLSHRVQESIGHLITATQESLRGLVLIRVHGTADLEREHFDKIAQENRQQSLKVVSTNAMSSSLVQVFLAIPVSFILFLASESWVHVSAGAFASLITAMIMIIKPVRRLATTNSNIQKGIAGAESIFDLLDQEAEGAGGEKHFTPQPGNWEIRGLTFFYKDDFQVLDRVGFRVQSGQTVGLVGASGGGKSTLVKILAALYPDYKGDIWIDGVNTREYSLSSLRSQIAYVGQDSMVFSTTVLGNITYGANQVNEERVWHCLELAQLADWVREQPNQLCVAVGELGAALSGGQRQRLAIARALYRDVPILILDEATSALDYETERKIQRAIESLKHKKTVFVVAHRLSTIESADIILVMHEGRVVEQGTHTQLLEFSGYYKKLHQLQSKDMFEHEVLS